MQESKNGKLGIIFQREISDMYICYKIPKKKKKKKRILTTVRKREILIGFDSIRCKKDYLLT